MLYAEDTFFLFTFYFVLLAGDYSEPSGKQHTAGFFFKKIDAFVAR